MFIKCLASSLKPGSGLSEEARLHSFRIPEFWWSRRQDRGRMAPQGAEGRVSHLVSQTLRRLGKMIGHHPPLHPVSISNKRSSPVGSRVSPMELHKLGKIRPSGLKFVYFKPKACAQARI